MTTVVFGFFAVLIARELPDPPARGPYLLAGIATALVGFARLYLGARWLSDLTGGVLLGVVWLLVLGIAYRGETRAFVLDADAGMDLLRQLRAGGAGMPAQHGRPARPLRTAAAVAGHRRRAMGVRAASTIRTTSTCRVRGDLALLRRRLESRRLARAAGGGLDRVIGLLDEDTGWRGSRCCRWPGCAPETLLLRRPGKRPDTLEVLRIWQAPVRLAAGRRCGSRGTNGCRRAGTWTCSRCGCRSRTRMPCRMTCACWRPAHVRPRRTVAGPARPALIAAGQPGPAASAMPSSRRCRRSWDRRAAAGAGAGPGRAAAVPGAIPPMPRLRTAPARDRRRPPARHRRPAPGSGAAVRPAARVRGAAAARARGLRAMPRPPPAGRCRARG